MGVRVSLGVLIMNKCTGCSLLSPYVYLGILWIECPNENCAYFSQRAKDLQGAVVADDDEEITVPDLYNMYPGILQ